MPPADAGDVGDALGDRPGSSRDTKTYPVRASLLRADDAAGHARNPYLAVFFVGADLGDDGFRDPLPRRFAGRTGTRRVRRCADADRRCGSADPAGGRSRSWRLTA